MNKGALGHRFEELNYRKLSPGEALVICPNCGEDNAENFRYCGMCGTLLEAPRPISVQKAIAAAEAARKGVTVTSEAPRPPAVENPPAPAAKPMPSISGPSLLGLDQSPSRSDDAKLPSMDSLRDRSFSGLDSFFEPEEPKTGGRRVLLLLILLAALGAAGWWTYSNYVGATGARGRQTANANPTPNTTTTAPVSSLPSEPSSSTTPSSTPPPVTAAPPSETPRPAATATAPAPTNNPPEPKPSQTVPSEAKKGATPTPVSRQKVAEAKPAPSPVAQPAPPAEDNGDAAFRKGEAYLYGRGVPENCDEAIKYLKDASAQRNAKARSTFGTMYATGHCVPRDFPTSYSWFAQALRVDPNNQILEKDLTAVWNQMTPPERQMATRLSQ
jgi:zinc-ribbon domain